MARDRRDNRHEGRDAWDRGSDEVRSWFGDEDAQRRREHDERRDERRGAYAGEDRRDGRRDDRRGAYARDARRDDRYDYRARGRWEDDDDDPRDIQQYVRDESGLETLDLTLGRGYGYGVAGAEDRYAGGQGRERAYTDDAGHQEFYRDTTSGFRGERGANLRSTSDYGEIWGNPHARGPQGHLYGQFTGRGTPIRSILGRWEDTIDSSDVAAGPFAGRGPRGYRRSDERIREEIADRLTADPWIDPSDVDVTVTDGRVTLSGTVDDRRVKYAVEDLVESISGVTDVENTIRVAR